MGGLIEAWPYLWTKYLICDRRNDGKDIVNKIDEDVVDGDDVGVHKSDNGVDVSAGSDDVNDDF